MGAAIIEAFRMNEHKISKYYQHENTSCIELSPAVVFSGAE